MPRPRRPSALLARRLLGARPLRIASGQIRMHFYWYRPAKWESLKESVDEEGRSFSGGSQNRAILRTAAKRQVAAGASPDRPIRAKRSRTVEAGTKARTATIIIMLKVTRPMKRAMP